MKPVLSLVRPHVPRVLLGQHIAPRRPMLPSPQPWWLKLLVRGTRWER